MNDVTDITVIACGSCVFEAMQAARMMEADAGLKVRFLICTPLSRLMKKL